MARYSTRQEKSLMQQAPVLVWLHCQNERPGLAENSRLTKRAPDALRAYDMGEVNGVKLTYVNGNVFATPAKRR